MKKRIVVTGVGVVSCFGNDAQVFFDSLLAGRSGVQRITDFPVDDYATHFAATINHFDAGEYLEKKQARRVDKFIAYGIVASKKALESANLPLDRSGDIDKTRCGVILGSGMGGMSVFSEGVQTMNEKGPRRITPFFIPYVITNMAGGLFAMDVGYMGPNYSISTACATGNNSIIAAAQHIRNGEADLMVCGGVEGGITPIGLAGFCSCKALSQRNDDPQRASRPWDKDRDGFVMGEGAGVLVLESLEHALKRGARILAEYAGGGNSCDAYHMTEPRSDGQGVALSLHRALADADVSPDAVNFINAHATSTPAGDMAEINALKSVFKDPRKITINATKSMIGHGLGAAGGLEAVGVILSIRNGVVHPTINLENPEAGIEAFNVPTKAQPLDIKVAISNTFGFGGHNSIVAFKPYQK